MTNLPHYVAQYSDTNITENAKVKDERFVHIAFAPASHKANVLVPDQFANVYRAFKSLFAEHEMPVQEHGTWVWTPIMQMTPEYMSSIIIGAKQEGVDVIYLSIDSYLDIFSLDHIEAKQTKRLIFENILKQFIYLASKEGIEVDAEAGWRNWAESGHTYKPFAIVNFVKEFNASNEHKFRGLQYDVEPYLLAEYHENDDGKGRVLERFVKLVDETASYLAGSGLKFSVVVPEFYDKRDDMTPKFKYNSRKDFAFGHLLNILEDLPDSALIIMSYRNFAEGEDGSIEVSENELKSAKRGGYKTNIVIAQETGDVLPPHITFYNTSRLHLKSEVAKLESAFSAHRNFAGIAIHYANAYLELR